MAQSQMQGDQALMIHFANLRHLDEFYHTELSFLRHARLLRR